jgi:hypothetical protein
LNYYKENIAKSNIDNLQAEIYFKYILYKEHLESLLKADDFVEKTISFKEEVSLDPYFSTNIIDEFYNLIKEYFKVEEHLILKELLFENKKPKNKLYFRSDGNKLLNAFKELIENNLITNVLKTELQDWICNNFQFRYNRTKDRKDYNPKTVEDTISNKLGKMRCKSPLFNIVNGNVIKV